MKATKSSVITDVGTAVVSIIIFIACMSLLPAFMPTAYAALVSIAIFIIFMSSGGLVISRNTQKSKN